MSLQSPLGGSNPIGKFNIGYNILLTVSQIVIPAGKTLYTKFIAIGTAYDYCTVRIPLINDNDTVEVSFDGKKNWTEVDVNVRTAIVESDGDGVYLRITSDIDGEGTILKTIKNVHGQLISPAIQVFLE